MAVEFDHAAVRLAVLGMRDAYGRNFASVQTSRHDLDAAGISAVDFMNWACALDERLGKTSDQKAYEARRKADDDGCVLPGLRHVRDRHMHQVVLSAHVDKRPWFGRFPPRLSAGIIWRSVDEIGDAPRSQQMKDQEGYDERRLAYERHIQGMKTWVTLRRALLWLTGEVEGRGVNLSPYEWP